MLIDSHCHLPPDQKFAKEIIDRARKENVTKFINVGTSIKDSNEAVSTAENFGDVFATVGVYPHEDQDKSVTEIKIELENLIRSSKKIKAVGECGIDLTNKSWERQLENQLGLFEMQIKLAIQNDLPIVIHNRNGDKHVIEMLNKFRGTKLTGVAHTFDGSWELAQKYLDLNFYISFSGFITFNSKSYLLKTVENVPLDKFLVETDSPYILPKGISKEQGAQQDDSKHPQNEPKNVRIVARKVSETKNLPVDVIHKRSLENTCTLFNLYGC